MSKRVKSIPDVPTDEQGVAILKRRDSEAVTDIDRVIEIIGMLPGLRRYGGEEAALEEAKAALQRVKERL